MLPEAKRQEERHMHVDNDNRDACSGWERIVPTDSLSSGPTLRSERTNKGVHSNTHHEPRSVIRRGEDTVEINRLVTTERSDVDFTDMRRYAN